MSRSPEDIRAALGANRPEPVRTQPHGPFGVLQLQAELAERLRTHSSAGRPSDPALTMRRLVGFRPETWQVLAEIADRASTPQRRISPGQVAARLIEDSLDRLRASTRLSDSNGPPDAAGSRRDT
jgi:hypothetical protein